MSAFEIRERFYLDGAPFQIISGSIHYFRVPPEYWDDRLKKLKAMGCNTVETYVPWNLHEPRRGEFCFRGGLDIGAFLRLARDNGLYAIVRPSPYICAEWEFGGLPAWLLAEEDVPLRTHRGPFLELVVNYYRALFPHLTPLQIDCGGPVLLMQVENEFGAWGEDDPAYLSALAGLMRDNGATVPFITSDNLENKSLSRGSCPGALATINFGSGAADKLEVLRPYVKGGPLMVTEFWVGWFDAWGDEVHHRTGSEGVAGDLAYILRQGSVNFYMFHGGTSFGWMNGANDYGRLTPDVTSYDYDAPLSEDGRPTQKYFAIQRVLERFNPGSTGALPVPLPRRAYGELRCRGRADLFSWLEKLGRAVEREAPCSMERLGQGYGYILYRTRLPAGLLGGRLAFAHAADRVQVFWNGRPVAARFDRELSVPVQITLDGEEGILDLLVENLGRVNYGRQMEHQRKGIDGPVRLDGEELRSWKCVPLPLDNLNSLVFSDGEAASPAFYRFALEVDSPADTFLDLSGWEKGTVFVNGRALGRFWDKGPQRRLYLPAPWLRMGENEIILFETEGRTGKTIVLWDEPDLGPEG